MTLCIATATRIMPPLCPPPREVANSACSRMHTAPNPLALRAPLGRTGLLAILDGCLAACLAHPLRPLARAPPLRGKYLFPPRYPTCATLKRGPARVASRFARWKTYLPRRDRGWGASPPKSTLAWARCIAGALLRFWLPLGNRRWTRLINPAARASP